MVTSGTRGGSAASGAKIGVLSSGAKIGGVSSAARGGGVSSGARGGGGTARGSKANAATGGARGAGAAASGLKGKGKGLASGSALKRSAVTHLANLKRARVDDEPLRRPANEASPIYGFLFVREKFFFFCRFSLVFDATITGD